MTRFTQKLARRGSQKWIQKLVNEKSHILESKIHKALNLSSEEDIHWLSPLQDDNYAEYRDDAFLNRLNIKLDTVSLADFWPKGGPQWDALGKSSKGKLFLVEAKSHIGELISDLRAKNKASISRINASLEDTKLHLNARKGADWTKNFYQYTNRLAHLHLLRKNNKDAYLVFIYFRNDKEMKGPSTVSEWQGAIKLLKACLGIGKHKLSNYIIELFIDVNQIK
ncbi:MAG: hypothetical protein QXZ70_01655 [Candidatus Bathyarchaeia archaeon]